MPSVETRRRRAANALRNDVEGGSNMNPTIQSSFDERYTQLKQQEQSSEGQSTANNPLLKFVLDYPAFIGVLFFILCVFIYQSITGFHQ